MATIGFGGQCAGVPSLSSVGEPRFGAMTRSEQRHVWTTAPIASRTVRGMVHEVATVVDTHAFTPERDRGDPMPCPSLRVRQLNRHGEARHRELIVLAIASSRPTYLTGAHPEHGLFGLATREPGITPRPTAGVSRTRRSRLDVDRLIE